MRAEIPEPFLIRLRKWLKEAYCVIFGHQRPKMVLYRLSYLWPTDKPRPTGWPKDTTIEWVCPRCERITRA